MPHAILHELSAPFAGPPLCRIEVEVGELVSLGRIAQGERRYVPLLGGSVGGAELQGTVVPGGVDWQLQRDDGVLEIQAHYVLRLADGSLVEVDSRGLRHGPPDVMRRLAAGEAVDPRRYFFRTFIRLATGAPAWQHLNRTMAVAVGAREAQRVVLDVHRIA
jgi:hypothetical protein